MVESDEKAAQDKNVDKTQIVKLLMIKFGLKTLKLIMMIMNFTYVIGMLYYVVSIFYADFILGLDLTNFDCPKDNRTYDFIHCRWDY